MSYLYRLLTAWLCLVRPHRWSEWYPTNPRRVVRVDRPFLAQRMCLRCSERDQLSIVTLDALGTIHHGPLATEIQEDEFRAMMRQLRSKP